MECSVIDFLRFCLHEDALPEDSFQSIDWNKLLEFGKSQSIVGVLFHGMERLNAGQASPISKTTFKSWLREVTIIREAAKTAYSATYKVTKMVHIKYGHRGCTLKGQGNALMYPDPYMRTSGDIDLWVAPNKGESIDDVIRLCRKIDKKCTVNYHHADIRPFMGIPVELHFRPSFIENLFYNHRLQKYFTVLREEQFQSFSTLPDNLGLICTPQDDFNLIFQLSHIQRHFFFEGIGMRHLVDYYYLLRHDFDKRQKAEYVRMLHNLNMTKFARGIMYVMQDFFGLDKDHILIEPDRRVGCFIMDEVLKTGNFGYSDTRFGFLRTDNRILAALSSVVKELRFIIQFPGEALFGHAVWILWWHFFYRFKIKRILDKA